jgi:hypothetical protein
LVRRSVTAVQPALRAFGENTADGAKAGGILFASFKACHQAGCGTPAWPVPLTDRNGAPLRRRHAQAGPQANRDQTRFIAG